MKRLFVHTIFLILAHSCYSQIVIGEKLISLSDKPENEITSYLKKTGWEYCGIDTENSKNFGINYSWRYKYDSATKLAKDLIIFTYKKVNSDSVLLISKEVSAIENYRIIKNISYLGFKKVKQHFMDKDIYSKKNIEVQVTHYSKWEKKRYLLSIYKLFKKST